MPTGILDKKGNLFQRPSSFFGFHAEDEQKAMNYKAAISLGPRPYLRPSHAWNYYPDTMRLMLDPALSSSRSSIKVNDGTGRLISGSQLGRFLA